MKMKLILMFFMMAAIAVFAKGGQNTGSHGTDHPNTSEWDGNVPGSFTYESGVFTMEKDGDMMLKLFQPASKNGQVVTNFGYYFINGQNAGKEFSLITKWTGKGTAVLPGNSTYTVPNLKKDDKIGFFCSYSDDTTAYSQQIKNADETDLFFPLTTKDQDVDYYTFGMDSDNWTTGGVLAFSFEGINITTEDSDTNGQPLPGVLTTCLIAGGIGGAYKLRKRKKQA